MNQTKYYTKRTPTVKPGVMCNFSFLSFLEMKASHQASDDGCMFLHSQLALCFEECFEVAL